MATYDELDQLSTQELHDRAWRRAKHHLDVKFFWELLKITPAAKEVEGDSSEAVNEIAHPSGQVIEALEEDPGLIEALRPVYLDYLVKHPDA
jgi:hypothetical protein